MTKPVRLAWCITDLDPGGAERALVQIVTRLDRTKFQSKVFCLSVRGELAEVLEQQGIPVECLGARHWRDLRVLGRLTRSFREWQPALVQTFLFHANILGRLAAWRVGIKHVVSGIRVADRRSDWRLRIDRWTDRLVERHVCVSQAVAEYSLREGGLPPHKVVVIPNGVDAEAFAKAAPLNLTELGVPPGSRVIMSVCRLDPQKGLTILIDAFGQIAGEFPTAHLVIVGEGPQRGELTTTIQDSNLVRRIQLPGYRPDIPRLLQGAECFALASLWEGMPNVVLEAMAARLPVVVSRVEGTLELVTAGQTGWLVEPGNVGDLAVALRQVLSDPLTARQVAGRGQRLVAEQFTWTSVAQRYEQLYQQLLHFDGSAPS